MSNAKVDELLEEIDRMLFDADLMVLNALSTKKATPISNKLMDARVKLVQADRLLRPRVP